MKVLRNNALKISPADNVAIAIREIKKGEPVIADGAQVCLAAEDIPASHKIALETIATGRPVIRYGEPIVVATSDIGVGQWVHLHNTKPLVE